MLRIWFVLCLTQIVFVAFGQQKQSFFRALTESEGLSESTNAYVFKDSEGFVWISSIDGLNRFDGRRARVFKPIPGNPSALYGNNIQSQFFEDRNGDIWFTTEKAINCYRKKIGQFEHFFIRFRDRWIQDQTHYAFFLDENAFLWITASDTLFKFDTQHPYSDSASQFLAPLPKAARCAVVNSKGGGKTLFASFWAYGPGFEMLQFDNFGRLQNRSTWTDDKLTVCYKVVCDERGSAWFATNNGLLHFDPTDPKGWQIFGLPEGNKEVRSISWLLDSLLLTISSSGSLWKFDLRSAAFEPWGKVYSKIEGQLVLNQTKTVNITSDRLVWCSSPGNGVFYSPLVAHSFTNVMGASHRSNLDFSQLNEDPDGLIRGLTYRDSLYVFDFNGKLIAKNKPPQHASLFQTGLGRTRLVSPEGIFELKGVKGISPRVGTDSLNLNLVSNCLLQWDNDVLLVGTTDGLYAIHQKTFTIEKLPFALDAPTVLFKSGYDELWVGTSSNLEVFSVKDDYSAKRIAFFGQTNMVNQIAQDAVLDNIAWVGTASGLLSINRTNWSSQCINEQNGLPNEYIQSVVPDLKGRIWLGTNKGIIRFIPNASELARFRLFDRRNGLSSNEYCRGAALRDRNGNIWFAGKKGVDMFHPDSIQDIGAPPQLAIVGLKVHDRGWPWDSSSTTSIEMARQIQLNYNENTIRLELAAMEYTDPEMNKFRVRLLKGENDTSWVDLGTQNFITYANLRPGKYRFEFTACNAEGIWQETPKSLDIIINPHFFDTWQFKLLMGGLALALIGFSTAFYYRYQLRLQQLALEKQQREAERKQLLLENELALQEERNRIADEMHDELGGGLSTIRLASQRAKKVQSPEELQHILKRVSQISIGLVNNMRGIIWAMDSQNDSLQSLLAYIRQYAVTILDDNGIEAQLSMPVEFPDVSMSSQYRHNVMLTVKECLNNILKHAEASKVTLHIELNGHLKIDICDNGKGFEPVEHTGMGKGLRTTVKRMESLGGSIEWRRNPEAGMCVTLQAPLP